MIDFTKLIPVAPTDPSGVASEERKGRLADSLDIRHRLHAVLRNPDRVELERRIRLQELLDAARSWRWGQANLLLLGPTECGKTTAAAYLFRRLLADAIRAGGDAWRQANRLAWFEAKQLLDASRGYPLGKGDVPEVSEACAASVLFFDEVGWERDPEVASLVLNERYKAGAPTIITSGKSPGELTAHYGAAVVRRMIESGGKVATVISCFQEGVVS